MAVHNSDEVGFLEQPGPRRDAAEGIFLEQPWSIIEQVVRHVFSQRLGSHALPREPADEYGQSSREKGCQKDQNGGKSQHLTSPILALRIALRVALSVARNSIRRLLQDGLRGDEDHHVPVLPGAPRKQPGRDVPAIWCADRAFQQEARTGGELYIRSVRYTDPGLHMQAKLIGREPFRRELYPKLVRPGSHIIATRPPDTR